MRPLTYLSILVHLASALSLTLGPALPLPLTLDPPSPSPPSPPSTLHRRVSEASHPQTDCLDGNTEYNLHGNHHPWVFQQSHCLRDNAWTSGSRQYRRFRTDCRAPGMPSMLQGPVSWNQEVHTVGYCAPTQICVDGPYTPPNAAMLHFAWYKRYGTAYCVEQQHLVGLAQDGLRVLGPQEAAGGAAGQAGGGAVAGKAGGGG
ncbi:hypothetical protein MMC15_005221 [Xylographa vitiligo]|nr:hypothetical protein [Xylographa vitiligo]